MKRLFFLLTILTISMGVIAQGNGHKHGQGNGKNKDKSHEKVKDKKNKDENEIAYPKEFSKQGKYKNHQPKKVAAALLRDYPNARNVTWSKYKGDYTATFTNGIWRSTAVYHANGERRDTRTPLTKAQLPGTIWDGIFKRDNIVPTKVIQIERPSFTDKIFRVLSTNNTAIYYDLNGNVVSYNY